MNKVHILKTITTLHEELTKRLAAEVALTNDPEKVAEYKRQLQQIQNEIDRIHMGRSYKSG
jgi:hypothetical protein